MTYRDFKLHETDSGILVQSPKGRTYGVPFKSVDDAKRAIDALYKARKARFTWDRWPP